MDNMSGAYLLGYCLGKFCTGAAIGGLIPLIIFAVKKQSGLGFLGLAFCGLAAFIHPAASAVVGAAFLIGAVKTFNNRN